MSSSDTNDASTNTIGIKAAASFRMEGVGSGDRIPYAKADLVKACRVGESYALSFYQMDYQDAVNASLAAETTGQRGDVLTIAIPVAKVVLDADGFWRLMHELQQLAVKLQGETK